MVKILGYEYVQSTPTMPTKGVKNNRTPKSNVAGGNIAGNSPQVKVSCIDNGTTICKDFYSFIKDNAERKVTRKYVDQIFTPLIGIEFSDWKSLYRKVFSNL